MRPSTSRLRGDEFLRLDAVICAIHGTGGEDGALLGALEHTDLPYSGGGVGAAAAAMNKATGKAVFRAAGIEVNPDVVIGRGEYTQNPAAAIAKTEAIGLPCFVKPVSLGSSIGVSRCATADQLEEAFELGFELDRAVLVEPALDDAIEINCAVLGRPEGELQTSVCEQPVKAEDSLLGFEEKYMSGAKGKDQAGGGAKEAGMASQDRLIPAPIPDDLTQAIQETARRAHRALGFAGVVRYDFLVTDPDGAAKVILNEANTVPGSFAFYLFEPIGSRLRRPRRHTDRDCPRRSAPSGARRPELSSRCCSKRTPLDGVGEVSERVMVASGGRSMEREISLRSGRRAANALEELGFEVETVDPDQRFVHRVSSVARTFVFVAMHGRGGEDGTLQDLLEILEIPYTGSDVHASARCLDKHAFKEMLDAEGLLTPPWHSFNREAFTAVRRRRNAAGADRPARLPPRRQARPRGLVAGDQGREQLRRVRHRRPRRLQPRRPGRDRALHRRARAGGHRARLRRDPRTLPVVEILTDEPYYTFTAHYETGAATLKVADLERGRARTSRDSRAHRLLARRLSRPRSRRHHPRQRGPTDPRDQHRAWPNRDRANAVCGGRGWARVR